LVQIFEGKVVEADKQDGNSTGVLTRLRK